MAEASVQECVEAYLYHDPPLELLLFRRPPSRGRIWVPIQGKVDLADRDFRSACVRELSEETGFVSFLRVVDLDYSVEWPGSDGRTWRLHAFGAQLPDRLEPTLNVENDSFEWVSSDEAIRRLHYPDNREAVRRLLETIRRPPTV